MKKILLIIVTFFVIIISVSHAQMVPVSNYFYNYYFDYPFFSNGSVRDGNFYYSLTFQWPATNETIDQLYTTYPTFGYYGYMPYTRWEKTLEEEEADLDFHRQAIEPYDRSRPFNVPFLNFNESDLGGLVNLTRPSFLEENNICNPESPLYYLNPSSPYYGRPLPTKGTWF